ncbi:MAG: M23 family metallopeptidase [Zetaproteobacteria bacterium]|nr:M23 family metallopeptidase [Zetaproteobacteria bacterium]
MLAIAKKSYGLHQVIAGHKFQRINDGDTEHVYYNIDDTRRIHFQRDNKEQVWSAAVEGREAESRIRTFRGTIDDNLFASAAAAGASERTIMNMIDMFAWDVDFARDIRQGDHFTLICEEHFDDQGQLLNNTILAAEFVNQNQVHRALRYTYANGNAEYFTPAGQSMRKAYLKSPVKFSRISSTFKASRKHPVLGYTRAHRGVDYAAPTGTPIRALGDGVITYYGWKGGYGRFVSIRHNNREHTTAYGHLSRYVKGLRTGSRVKQGQIIGYVGMSGLATGPHLHFEFRVRGQAINPLSVKHRAADPIARSEMKSFKSQTQGLEHKLDQPDTTVNWG